EVVPGGCRTGPSRRWLASGGRAAAACRLASPFLTPAETAPRDSASADFFHAGKLGWTEAFSQGFVLDGQAYRTFGALEFRVPPAKFAGVVFSGPPLPALPCGVDGIAVGLSQPSLPWHIAVSPRAAGGHLDHAYRLAEQQEVRNPRRLDTEQAVLL